jgi:hypothetical protein
MNAPAFSAFSNIYTETVFTDDGSVDPRVWFYLPIFYDDETKTYTYFLFPYGANEDEIQELTFDAAAFSY